MFTHNAIVKAKCHMTDPILGYVFVKNTFFLVCVTWKIQTQTTSSIGFFFNISITFDNFLRLEKRITRLTELFFTLLYKRILLLWF